MATNLIRRALFTAFLVTSLPCVSSAQTICDASLVRAFSDVYKEDVDKVTYERLYAKSCANRTSNSGISVSVPVEGVPFSFGLSSSGSRSACAAKDQTYFSSYSGHFLILRTQDSIKEELVRACFGGVELVATENNGSIGITAFGKPTGDHLVMVRDFVAAPRNGVRVVDPPAFPRDSIVSMRGITESFQRTSPYAVTFTLNTKLDGTDSVTVPGREVVQVTWSHRLYSRDRAPFRFFVCRATLPGGIAQDVGSGWDARLQGTEGRGSHELRNAFCRMNYGPIVRFEPGSVAPLSIPDEWIEEAVDSEAPSTSWLCTRNGVQLPQPLECPGNPAADVLCNKKVGRQVYCAARYQNLNRLAEEDYRDVGRALPTSNTVPIDLREFLAPTELQNFERDLGDGFLEPASGSRGR